MTRFRISMPLYVDGVRRGDPIVVGYGGDHPDTVLDKVPPYLGSDERDQVERDRPQGRVTDPTDWIVGTVARVRAGRPVTVTTLNGQRRDVGDACHYRYAHREQIPDPHVALAFAAAAPTYAMAEDVLYQHAIASPPPRPADQPAVLHRSGDRPMTTHHARPAWQMPPGLPQAADDTWTYILDDFGVTYGTGWWPLHADRTSPQAALSTDRTPQPCGVRLAPDVAYYAWHTEYVSLYPTDETGVIAGSCYVVPHDTPRHHAHRVPFQLRLVGDDWVAERVGPATVGQDILAEKMRRASDFLRAAIAERDAGADQPTTAADLYAAEQEAATPTTKERNPAVIPPDLP